MGNNETSGPMGRKVELIKCTYFWNTPFPFRFLYTLPSFCVGR